MSTLRTRLRNFFRSNEGSVSVEAILVLPAMVYIFGASWVWFDVSRQQSVNQKANYTIGDMISRETDPIDDAYIDATYSLYQDLVIADNSTTDLRVSVVEYRDRGWAGKYSVEWSSSRGAYPPLTDSDLVGMQGRLPIMADGDEILLVETWEDYEPALEAGLSAFEIETYSFTSPRFAPQLLWGEEREKNANNGWGNGDQEAPGNSLCNNNAENADEGAASQECATNERGNSNNEKKGPKGS